VIGPFGLSGMMSAAPAAVPTGGGGSWYVLPLMTVVPNPVAARDGREVAASSVETAATPSENLKTLPAPPAADFRAPAARRRRHESLTPRRACGESNARL